MMKRFLFLIGILLTAVISHAQEIWECTSYPDEAGFKIRTSPIIKRIAAEGYGIRSLAPSTCPDTGLPVSTWAVEGEKIISPYTGRVYTQGPTGYFGPRTRNDKGEIIAFGGDPLKYELPPATASIMLNPDDVKAKAFLSIPGNLRQQYHFACTNWARFYPLVHEEMSDEWHRNFYHWISIYGENKRPSDGNREWLKLSKPHNLVGETDELLGGNSFDGGTENHKVMWRTSALLYSQLFPDSTKISGYSLNEAEAITKQSIRLFLKKLTYVGNGEYDSEVYYPYSIKSFLNLYDFSPDPETKLLAKFALDYYFATYGLKSLHGALAGPQKRGYLPDHDPDMIESMQWVFFNDARKNMDHAVVTLHQATTSYRPNKIIWNITRKEIPLPFEAKMARPFYHMDFPFAFVETFYGSNNFAMGNMQMTIVDNPNQQMVWSLVTTDKEHTYSFSGGHPMRISTSGHSPYTQTLQSKGTLILVTAPTKTVVMDTLIGPRYSKEKRVNMWILPRAEQPDNFEMVHRQKFGHKPLHAISSEPPVTAESISKFWTESTNSASSWFYFPKELVPRIIGGTYFFDAGDAYVAVIPFTKNHFVVNPADAIVKKFTEGDMIKFFKTYGFIAFTGSVSGYVVEVVEKNKYSSIETFASALKKKNKVKINRQGDVDVQSIHGDTLKLVYQPTGLRCRGYVNGVERDWNNYTNGAVYVSPYVDVKDGIMKISDGKESFEVDFTGDLPVYKN